MSSSRGAYFVYLYPEARHLRERGDYAFITTHIFSERRYAISSINQFILLMPDSLQQHMDAFLSGLNQLKSDPSVDVSLSLALSPDALSHSPTSLSSDVSHQLPYFRRDHFLQFAEITFAFAEIGCLVH